MVFGKIEISCIFLVVVFLMYNYLIFDFADGILEKPKLKKYCSILVGIVNIFLISIFVLMEITSLFVYIFVFILLTTEFYLFYNDKITRILFFASAFILHIMAVRAICVAIFSFVVGVSFYDIVSDTYLLILSTSATFFILDIVVIFVKNMIPAENIRIINQHDEQFWFLALWSIVCNTYLIFNSQIYSINEGYSFLNSFQIVTSVAILITLYGVMFFLIKNIRLLGYKEKSSQLETEMNREHQYRNAIISDAISNFEFNITNNEIVVGFEDYRGVLNDEVIKNYTKMLDFVANNLVYCEDLENFKKFVSIENLKYQISIGKNEVIAEYRRLQADGKYIWVRAITNLVREFNTNEIKGFTYVKDIDEEKKLQLDLKFKAERDSLTGLYNKGMTGSLISKQLEMNCNNGLLSALIIIDIDNFKNVNDSLGHTFGDVVLCELSEKLRKIFRGNDIIGRIGGDEFIAFMTNLKNSDVVKTKALEICVNFRNILAGNECITPNISCSIGIAISPMHGNSYEQLYKNSDVALYASKNKGKNTYTVYDGEDFTKYQSNRTEIDSQNSLSQKSFKTNRIEYIFKILYGAETPLLAISSVLELLTSHFDFSRGYIFENSDDGLTASNTFEWCAENVEPQIEILQNVPVTIMDNAFNSFHKTGSYILRSLNDGSWDEREILEPQGIKSMLQFGVFEQNKMIGFIGFDDCIKERVIVDSEIDEIFTICNILGTFVVKQRAIEKAAKNLSSLSAILNSLDCFTYVINKDNFKILFMNEKTKSFANDAMNGQLCFNAFRGNDKPCNDCPIYGLGDALNAKCVQEIYNEKYGVWTETTACYVNWIDGENACLLNCIDITRYKKHV